MPAKDPEKMIKKLKKLLALTILAATSISCSPALLNDEEESLDGNLKIVVNGVVSDVVTNAPISDIKITFSAFAENSPSVLPLISKTVNTDGKGVYTVEATGFTGPVTCTLTAESMEDATVKYETMTNKIVVASNNGTTLDADSNTFVVNDCNFQMKKR